MTFATVQRINQSNCLPKQYGPMFRIFWLLLSAFFFSVLANSHISEASGGPGAKGRLTTATDGSGSTKYAYDNHGRVLSKSQAFVTEAAKTQTVSYLPTGQLNEHTLPSGAVVKYSYRADGRVVSIQVNGVTIVSELDYFPFGELKSYKYNAADRYVRSFDTNGRVKEHTAGDRTRTIGFDPGSRITSIADGAGSSNQWAYGYDTLDRLKTAENTATTGSIANTKLGWTFDATGNRTSEARGTPAVSTTYAIDSVSNKLNQVGAQARTYDPVGNTVAIGIDQSVYSSRNRLVRATKAGITADYSYNAFGEGVKKTVGANASQFVYDEDGHVLGDYNTTGALVSEYVWLGDMPVAVIKPTGSTQAGIAAGANKVYIIHADHLDTPRVIVNAANQPVWRWDSAPFGDTAANEQPTASLASFQFSLRFPGQQFDAETASHYNYFRDYEAGTGRYLQSDPIGLMGGPSTYVYVSTDPLKLSDRSGLVPKVANVGSCTLTGSPQKTGGGNGPSHAGDSWNWAMNAASGGNCKIFFNMEMNSIFGCGGKERPDAVVIYPNGTCDICEVTSPSQKPADQLLKAQKLFGLSGKVAGPLGGGVVK